MHTDNKKFTVTYDLLLKRSTMMGVTATSETEAIGIAKDMANLGTLWDNTQETPLLSDDYVGTYDGEFTCYAWEVPEFPEADESVTFTKQKEAAFAACQALLSDQYEEAAVLAKQAMPLLAESLETNESIKLW